MFTLLYESDVKIFETLDDALEYAKDLAVAYTILDSDNKVVWDYMDRIGP